MISYLKSLKKYSTAGKYISSGLLLTLGKTISGFIILRWLAPSSLGKWQSFTVFVGYIQILTLGTTSGLNRELPYWLGKGNREVGIERLKTAGYFTTMLSFAIMAIIVVVSFILYNLNVLNMNEAIMLTLAFSTGALSIQTNFLGATYRSAQSFNKLSRIQIFNSILYVLLIPLVYFFNLWGYIAYQMLLALALYLGYMFFRPYKVGYKFDSSQLKVLVKIGFPMYIWNYIASITRTIPRLILVIFGNPLLVGLYSPAGSINAAVLTLPAYINRYLFPKMSFMLGQNEDANQVYKYTMKASKYLFLVMLVGATIIAIIIPPIFKIVFPKYVEGIIPAQITLYSGVFYSVNSLMHLALNSLKIYQPFKYIVSLRIVFILIFTYIAFLLTKSLVLSVAIGSVSSEFFNLFGYFYFLRRAVSQYKTE